MVDHTLGRLIPASLDKPGLEWSLLDKKGVAITVSLDQTILKTLSPTGVPVYPNVNWSGDGAVTGTCKVGSAPVHRRVRLYEAKTGILIKEIWSNEDGSYSFPGLSKLIKFTVTATDYSNTYNDVIAANVTAV